MIIHVSAEGMSIVVSLAQSGLDFNNFYQSLLEILTPIKLQGVGVLARVYSIVYILGYIPPSIK